MCHLAGYILEGPVRDAYVIMLIQAGEIAHLGHPAPSPDSRTLMNGGSLGFPGRAGRAAGPRDLWPTPRPFAEIITKGKPDGVMLGALREWEDHLSLDD